MQEARYRPFRTGLAFALALALALILAPRLLAGEKEMTKTKPKAIHKVMAEYPEEAREARTEGVVVAELSIAADGSVSAVEVKEGDEVFHQVTIDALEQWKFEPMAEATDFQVTIRFRLDGEKDSGDQGPLKKKVKV